MLMKPEYVIKNIASLQVQQIRNSYKLSLLFTARHLIAFQQFF